MTDRKTSPRHGFPQGRTEHAYDATAPSAVPQALAAAGLAALPFLAGCNVAVVGNLFVVAVTVGIFFGTLGLGRSATRSSERSTSESSRS